ncbi:MAG: 5-formyltetrahydrofolate cyclo-ligase [Gammaproteobacteria bacterium RIFCSPHIGHO2_12_FULL_37_34]|nr:MAG: 5-formyltetrahydrofolate cyclo-ligase [Gammaproteobacteria bacterium RIFCSPHIGHO2_12_FULL_37_34]
MSARLKQELRKIYYAKRREIPTLVRQQTSRMAADYFLQLDLFEHSQHIACYTPFRDEFDSIPVIQKIWQANKLCYLPILTEKKELFFVRYNEGDKLITNRYSILEPHNTLRRIQAQDLDMVVTPLVVFDTDGHRLGTGGGYYDRTFAFLRQNEKHKKPWMVGLCFSIQQAEQVPTDPWDINLQAVVTENGMIDCRGLDNTNMN